MQKTQRLFSSLVLETFIPLFYFLPPPYASMQRLCCLCSRRNEAEDDTEEQQQTFEYRIEERNTQASGKPLPTPKVQSRATHAHTLVLDAQIRREQLAFHHTLAYNLQDNDAYSVDQRAANVVKLLQEDNARNQPWTDFSFELGTGSLLLTDLLKFIELCCTAYANGKKTQPVAWKLLAPQLPFINHLLSQPPPTKRLRDHAEERGALAFLAFLMYPTLFHGPFSHAFLLDLARSILKRGADIHARDIKGRTPIQNWCIYKGLTSATGLVFLLEAGADLDASHSDAKATVLHVLCTNKRKQVLCELSEKGWLGMSSHIESAIQLLKSMLVENPTDAEVKCILQLLFSDQQHWMSHGRPAVTALLCTWEQLVPDIAELIVSYIDGGRRANHAS
jgi:hypothetical protein